MNIKDVRDMTADEMTRWKSIYPNFMPIELCTDDFSLKMDSDALLALQLVRERLGRPMTITSAYRNKEHNKRVGGRKNSQHVKGLAFDIAVPDMEYAKEVERLAIDEGFTAIGRYPSSNFIHIDFRKAKPNGKLYRWGDDWD